eukprot:SAG11_NODE_2513_length_3267_cov_2.052399_4_plen_171_part_00
MSKFTTVASEMLAIPPVWFLRDVKVFFAGRYRDENGLSIFGNASHRSWRIERSLEAIRPALNARLAKSIVETDIAHWYAALTWPSCFAATCETTFESGDCGSRRNSLQTFTPVQHILEVEYIEYDGAAEGPPPKIEPHVDSTNSRICFPPKPTKLNDVHQYIELHQIFVT